MTLKTITILSSISPITLLGKPSKLTNEYLAKITQNKEFKDFSEILRTQNNFPKDGISIKEFIGKNFFELPVINNQLILQALQYSMHQISKSIGLSDDFNTQLLLLIFFNAFVDVDYFEGFVTTPIQFILGRKNIGTAMYDFPHEVGAIIIPFNMSKRTLLKWIEDNKNWDDIQKQMDNNLTTDPFLLRIHKNTDLAMEIISLKDSEDKTFSKIANELSKKYPENEFLNSEEYIKKIYYDYKVIYSSLPKSTEKK